MRICFSDSNLRFNGTPQRVPKMTVKNYQDALKCWEYLQHAKYLDAHKNSFYDKMIRAENYSFLDKITSNYDKMQFVNKFCEFTNFPFLKKISDKIDSTFQACINKIANDSNYGNKGAYSIVDSGYDPTCSLGLKKSFPGSDLDKGYIILEGNSPWQSDDEVVMQFKGKLWEDLDQRIVSLNHPDTFPSVYTKSQVNSILDSLDAKARDIESSLNLKRGAGLFLGITAMSLLGPLGIIGGSALAGAVLAKVFNKQADTVNPYEAAKFNRKIAEKISSSEKREEAKNFAFFIEIVKANLDRNSYGKQDSIFTRIKESLFVQNSNVTQVEAWQKRINNGYLKSKLRNRENLESDFNRMSDDTKYELVKDIIKYMTDDQSGRFSEYFKNDDDIANRYEPLLNSLR